VFATARKPQDVERLRDLGFESVVLDYADDDSISQAVAYVTNQTGGTLDAVFNNGAFACPGAVEDLPRGALCEIYETNLFGVHELTRQVIPIMRAQGHGRIVNCSSVLGMVPLKWRGAYNSTKFALEGLTHTLRLEMRETGIDIILIQPGPVTSDIRKNSIPQFERWIDWKGSARASQYKTRLIPRLYTDSGPDTFELPASAVTKKLRHALESKRPKLNYYVTTPTYFMSVAKRVLPARALDWLLDKF